jgi:hypothetical protein
LGKLKNAELIVEPLVRTNFSGTRTVQMPSDHPGEAYDDPTDSRTAKTLPRARPVATPGVKPPGKPTGKLLPGRDRFTYALAQYTAEIRKDGWYICKTPFTSAGEKANWAGPCETIEHAARAIALRLATEIATRHTKQVDAMGLKSGDPLHGFALSRKRAKGSKPWPLR